MAEPKYSLETRLAVVNHYLSGKDGTRRTAEYFGVERKHRFAVGPEPDNYTVLMASLGKMTAIPLSSGSLLPGLLSIKNFRCSEAAARFNISNETAIRYSDREFTSW